MRSFLSLMCALILTAGPSSSSSAAAASPRRLVNRSSLAHAAGSATWGQIRNSPHEWGRGASGFGKRVASSLGQHAIKTTIQAGVGALHHEDLKYHRSNRKGTLPRLEYAVTSTFWVPRKNRPGHTVALGRVSGNMGAGMVSRLWLPASAGGIGAGIASGGIGLGAEAGVNVAREFWPRHRRSAEPRW